MAYFDYAANPPVDERVLDTFNEVTKKYFANPNSFHKLGQETATRLDASSAHIATMLECDKEDIIYTSGATEANNLALKGIAERYRGRGRHILLSPLEHNSITASATALSKQGFEIEMLNIDKEGRVDKQDLARKLREDTILVSIAAVDSELAIVQDIAALAAYVKAHSRAFFHCDASQAIAKVTIDYHDCDLLTLTPHKFYGLNGSGALIKRTKVMLIPQINGGRSTTIYRSGTPVVGQVAAFDKALTLVLNEMDERLRIISAYHDQMRAFLNNYKNVHLNSTRYSLPHVLNFSIINAKNARFPDLLEKEGIYVSAKTSCCPANTPSKPIYALTKSRALALNSVRVSLSHLTTDEDMEAFYQGFDRAYHALFH